MMNTNNFQSALWQKLESFQVDQGGATFTFTHRLAQENGWTLEFSRRAIEEYKRFVFLCVASGHPCSPSAAVDEVWHLHLTYTRSYWEQMCGEVLGRPLHHDPTKGGRDEAEKFVDWYARTLQSYRELFGQEPPSELWPPVQQRFVEDPVVKVDRGSNWVLSKSSAATHVGLGVLVASTLGCVGTGAGFLAVILIVGFIGLLIAFWPRYGRGGNSTGGCSAGYAGGGSGDSGGDSCDGGSGCGGGGCGGGGD